MAIARTTSVAGTQDSDSFNVSLTGGFIVMLVDYDNTTTLASATIGGNAVTVVATVNNTSEGYRSTICTISGTFSGSTAVTLTWAGSTPTSRWPYFLGYSGAGGVNTSATAFNTTASLSLTTTVDNCWLVGMGHSAGGDTTFAGSTRQNGILENGANTSHNRLVIGDSNGPVTPAGATSQVYVTGGGTNFSKIAVAIFPFTAYTMTAAQGSYTYTGYAATLFKTVSYILTAAQGSYAYTGYAATLTFQMFTRWVTSLVKTAITPTNATKNSASSPTNQTKNTSTWTNRPKNI